MQERTVPYQTGSDIRGKIFFRTVERERNGNLRAVNGRYLAGAYAVVLQPCLNRYNAFIAVFSNAIIGGTVQRYSDRFRCFLELAVDIDSQRIVNTAGIGKNNIDLQLPCNRLFIAGVAAVARISGVSGVAGITRIACIVA